MRTISLRFRPLFAVVLLLFIICFALALVLRRQTYQRAIIVQRDVIKEDPTICKYVIAEPVEKVNVTIPLEVYNIKDKITKLAQKVYKAKKHVRGIKTGDNLREAVEILDGILSDLGVDSAPLKERQTIQSTSICPEEYKGTTFGYPFFYKGFEMTNCSYGKSLASLVSVVIQINKDQYTDVGVKKLLNSVPVIHQNISILVQTDLDDTIVDKIKEQYPGIVVESSSYSQGNSWNNLFKHVKTPYTLVARGVNFFTNDTRLERLVREIERLNVSVVGGAHRTPDGHWKNGCFQSAYRNYSLSYVEGYDESFHECLFCDHIDSSPFLARTNVLKEVQFSSIAEVEGLFEDFFLRLTTRHLESAVCPDSMFHVKDKLPEKRQWDRFSSDWELYSITTPRGTVLDRSCRHVPSGGNALAKSPCILQANADVVNFIMNTCAENDVLCELQEGTALGAMKFEKVLPWEMDGDITFLSGNYTAFQNLESKFISAGYGFVDLKALWCCADNRTAGGKFNIRTSGWNIELYGQHMMDSELLLSAGIRPTQVLLDGNWVNVPRNPGLFVRNRYAHEIYRHALHWMTTHDTDGWILYQTNMFKACSKPDHHACLDRLNADGNLGFTNPLP